MQRHERGRRTVREPIREADRDTIGQHCEHEDDQHAQVCRDNTGLDPPALEDQ
jgi:hypothetical protein